MINHKLLCLILLVIGSNFMNSQKIDYKLLLGIEHNNLVGDTIQLEKNTFDAFEKMKKAALQDGVNIKIVSGFRDFERQKKYGIQSLKGLQMNINYPLMKPLTK